MASSPFFYVVYQACLPPGTAIPTLRAGLLLFRNSQRGPSGRVGRLRFTRPLDEVVSEMTALGPLISGL